MRRLHWYHWVLMLLLLPSTSPAIQLHWRSGSDALTFTEATRCTLVVQADVNEGRLPGEWRLLWIADSCEIRPVPVASQPCQVDVAEVVGVRGPSNPPELAANLLTTQLCSSGGEATSTAYFVLDLPARGKGKLKVVALDPTDPDSSRVLPGRV